MHDQILSQLGAALVQGSLTDEALLAETDVQPVVPILPDANVIKVGGQSFIDRGRAAVFPLLDELVENLARHKMIVGTGAGTRSRRSSLPRASSICSMPITLRGRRGASAARPGA